MSLAALSLITLTVSLVPQFKPCLHAESDGSDHRPHRDEGENLEGEPEHQSRPRVEMQFIATSPVLLSQRIWGFRPLRPVHAKALDYLVTPAARAQKRPGDARPVVFLAFMISGPLALRRWQP